MKPSQANIINAATLVGLGLYAYLTSHSPSPTALIPVGIGALLLAITPWFKPGRKVAAHIAVGLTLILFVSLFKPLSGALSRADNAAMIRVGIMMATSLFALIVFIRSFVLARIKK